MGLVGVQSGQALWALLDADHQSEVRSTEPDISGQCLQVKALEAADAARKKEAQKAAERAAQRQQVEAQKAERAKRAQDAKVGNKAVHPLACMHC